MASMMLRIGSKLASGMPTDSSPSSVERTPRRLDCESPQVLDQVADSLPVDRTAIRRSHSPADELESIPAEALPHMHSEERRACNSHRLLESISGDLPVVRHEERMGHMNSEVLEAASAGLPHQRNPARRAHEEQAVLSGIKL